MHQVNAGRLSDFAAGFGGQGKERTLYARLVPFVCSCVLGLVWSMGREIYMCVGTTYLYHEKKSPPTYPHTHVYIHAPPPKPHHHSPDGPFDGSSNVPTTPMGVMKYLEACGIDVAPGARCLVVGAVCGWLVG